MSTVPDDDLVRHARALRGLARSLVAAQDADDLVQDAALQALRRPPAHVRSWLAWLAGVLRKRAAKQHRGQARRERRERAQPGREPDADALPLRVAAHRETIARLDAALLALSEPYQSTLLLRFFEDLTPTAIAARTGESLATVKSRLQRGLELLRQRLAADEHGRDWRGGLVAAFGLGRRSAVAGLVAAGVMTMVAKLVFGAAAAALAVVFLWPAPAPSLPASAANARVDAAAPAHSELVASGQRTEATPPPAPAPDANAAANGGDALATYVGRCVDEQGAPLAGVSVVGSCRTNQGGDRRGSEAVLSAEDGRFRVRLPLAPKAHQELVLECADRCEVRGNFGGVAGETVELGDVVVPLACSVRGRVVDRAGQPQEGVRVRLRPPGREGPPMSPYWFDNVMTSAADGSFALQRVPTGRYAPVTENRRLADGSSKDIELGPSVRSLEFELVVEAAPSPCRGIVVDESGAPLAGASVDMDSESVRTGSDGRFTLAPVPNGVDPERRVSVDLGGYVRRDVTWGRGDTSELRVVLTRQPDVTIRVVDAGGAPVTAFALRVIAPELGFNQYRDMAPVHDGGICRLAVPPGDWSVFVQPRDETLAPSAFVPLRVEAGRATEITVVIAPWQQRRLVVSDGQRPMAGVGVELLDPGEVRVRRGTETFPVDDIKIAGSQFAAILQEGTTDADGALPLRGPRGALALRLTGGGVAVQIVQPARLDEAGDLVVVAERAAQWRGKLTPPDVAAALLATKVPPGSPQERVGIELANADGSLRRYFEPRFPFAADGSFAIDGLPAGTWYVIVGSRPAVAVATITLRAGEVLTQDVDVRALAPADVTLRVRIDGKPAANTLVNVLGQHAADVFGRRFGSGTSEPTDDAGCRTFRTYVGDLTFHVYLDQPGARLGILVAAASVRVPGPQELALDLQLGKLDLDVRTPDGAPAAGVPFELTPVGALYPNQVRTAADGSLRVPVFAGSYALRVRPKSLSTWEAQDAFLRTHGQPALENAWIAVGTIDVAPAASQPHRLTLPDAWAR